jgi:pilus assembly protein CpaC
LKHLARLTAIFLPASILLAGLAAQAQPVVMAAATGQPALPSPYVQNGDAAPFVQYQTQLQTPLPVSPAQAQAPQQPAQQGLQQTSQPPSAGQPATAPLVQNVTVPAGNGVLLHLPRAAATIMSADPTVARVQPASPTSLFLMGVAAGRTDVIATGEAGDAIVQYNVTVTPGGKAAAGAPAAPPPGVSPATAAAIETAIARTVREAAGVRVRAAGDQVILTGTAQTAVAAHQAEAIARAYIGEKAGVIDQIAVMSSIQVNVRVRIAEISRTLTQQLGFNWQALMNPGHFRFGFLTGQAASGVISPLLPLGIAPQANAPIANQIGAGYSTSHYDINGVIDALAANQLITILAEPNLTAQSGETASFLAGGEFPIPVTGNSGTQGLTITVEYKTYGVSLAVVPTVLSPTRLNLRVRPEVSELSTQGQVSVPIQGATLTIPALTVRRAETTIELGSGQSFAIAGLLEKTGSETINGVPFLQEVPVLGRLFQSNAFQRGETELVIIVTPYLVQPAASSADVTAPVADFRPATELDRLLFDRELAPYSYLGSFPKVDAGFMLR